MQIVVRILRSAKPSKGDGGEQVETAVIVDIDQENPFTREETESQRRGRGFGHRSFSRVQVLVAAAIIAALLLVAAPLLASTLQKMPQMIHSLPHVARGQSPLPLDWTGVLRLTMLAVTTVIEAICLILAFSSHRLVELVLKKVGMDHCRWARYLLWVAVFGLCCGFTVIAGVELWHRVGECLASVHF